MPSSTFVQSYEIVRIEHNTRQRVALQLFALEQGGQMSAVLRSTMNIMR